MKKWFLMLAIIFALCMTTMVPAHAAEETEGEAVGGGVAQPTEPIFTEVAKEDTESTEGYYGNILSPDEIINPNGGKVVTTEDVNQYIDRKGGEVISIFTSIAQYASIIGFFFSLICIVIGALGNKRTMTGGFVGLCICCVIFTAATCGLQIISYVSAWLRS